MRELNEELIGKVLDHIEAHPETHNQNMYRYTYDDGRVVMCFAGHATRIALEDETDESLVEVVTNRVTGETYRWSADSTHVYAAKKLGLTTDEAWQLFLDAEDLGGVKQLLAVFRLNRTA